MSDFMGLGIAMWPDQIRRDLREEACAGGPNMAAETRSFAEPWRVRSIKSIEWPSVAKQLALSILLRRNLGLATPSSTMT